jgi:hypothetical protein
LIFNKYGSEEGAFDVTCRVLQHLSEDQEYPGAAVDFFVFKLGIFSPVILYHREKNWIPFHF